MNRAKIKLSVFIIQEDDTYVAFCPGFSVANEGENVKSVLYNVKEALQLFLEEKDFKKDYNRTKYNYS